TMSPRSRKACSTAGKSFLLDTASNTPRLRSARSARWNDAEAFQRCRSVSRIVPVPAVNPLEPGFPQDSAPCRVIQIQDHAFCRGPAQRRKASGDEFGERGKQL